ncbi:hypothetical protein EW026_g1746 [Hermanssonia centrifuga]|uniref:Nuclear pore complex protein NUP96 C-terminal domain-containing protein n=1 Tax=Hermanssonia centrifuga TaxID=98765 RepID=A0A4S4KQH7_9APHY|nr:hypothetical protein EW026_g1746 [Hermanssonia centrifuga]
MVFGSFATLFPPTDRSFEALLFRLGHVLFDPIDLRLADAVTVDIRNRITTLRRKTALSKWLQSAVSTAVDADVRENSGDCTATVFALLTGDQVEKACNVAMDNGDVKLATLLAQAGGDEEFKEDIRAQLAIWREQRIDAHVDENIRKVYALLAGVVGVLEGSKGSGFERCPDVHLSKGLDWKRAFGLHFWFGDALDAPASSAFESYSRHMSQEGSSVAQPVPWYKEESDQCTTGWKLPSGSEPPDALFSLIKLSSKPACSLSQVLTPLSFSPSPSDYRLPWHLYILLSRCLRIRDFADRGDPGVRTDEDDASSESGVEGHSPSADLLASSFALQLEQTGMLQEAVFVLLHIEGSSGRRRAIKDLLGRNAIRLDDWITRGLIGSLKIPMAWINEAKAVHALASGNVYEAYELYLAAGMYNSAHELAVLELAPDAIIKDDLELLKDLFERIDGHAVDGWHVRGKAFLDYAHAMTRLPELRERLVGVNAVPDVTDTTELEELSRSVPKLIGILPDVLHDHSDIRHTAALAEMISGLTLRLDQLRPPAVGSLRSAPVPEATKLHHMRSVAYEKFLRTIEVA